LTISSTLAVSKNQKVPVWSPPVAIGGRPARAAPPAC
jgi:hypothetical protein